MPPNEPPTDQWACTATRPTPRWQLLQTADANPARPQLLAARAPPPAAPHPGGPLGDPPGRSPRRSSCVWAPSATAAARSAALPPRRLRGAATGAVRAQPADPPRAEARPAPGRLRRQQRRREEPPGPSNNLSAPAPRPPQWMPPRPTGAPRATSHERARGATPAPRPAMATRTVRAPRGRATRASSADASSRSDICGAAGIEQHRGHAPSPRASPGPPDCLRPRSPGRAHVEGARPGPRGSGSGEDLEAGRPRTGAREPHNRGAKSEAARRQGPGPAPSRTPRRPRGPAARASQPAARVHWPRPPSRGEPCHVEQSSRRALEEADERAPAHRLQRPAPARARGAAGPEPDGRDPEDEQTRDESEHGRPLHQVPARVHRPSVRLEDVLTRMPSTGTPPRCRSPLPTRARARAAARRSWRWASDRDRGGHARGPRRPPPRPRHARGRRARSLTSTPGRSRRGAPRGARPAGPTPPPGPGAPADRRRACPPADGVAPRGARPGDGRTRPSSPVSRSARTAARGRTGEGLLDGLLAFVRSDQRQATGRRLEPAGRVGEPLVHRRHQSHTTSPGQGIEDAREDGEPPMRSRAHRAAASAVPVRASRTPRGPPGVRPRPLGRRRRPHRRRRTQGPTPRARTAALAPATRRRIRAVRTRPEDSPRPQARSEAEDDEREERQPGGPPGSGTRTRPATPASPSGHAWSTAGRSKEQRAALPGRRIPASPARRPLRAPRPRPGGRSLAARPPPGRDRGPSAGARARARDGGRGPRHRARPMRGPGPRGSDLRAARPCRSAGPLQERRRSHAQEPLPSHARIEPGPNPARAPRRPARAAGRKGSARRVTPQLPSGGGSSRWR